MEQQLTDPTEMPAIPADTSGAESAFPDLPAEMLEGIASHNTLADALVAIAESIARRVEVVGIGYFGRPHEDGALPDHPSVLTGNFTPESSLPAMDASRLACQQGMLQITAAGEDHFIVVAPVIAQNRLPDAIVALVTANGEDELAPVGLKTTASPTRVGEMLQLAATHVTLWHTLQSVVEAERHADHISGLLEILGKVEAAETLRSATLTLVGELREFVDCQRVAVAMRRNGTGPCRLQAISGYEKFDEHAPFAQAIQAALDETILLNRVSTWPAESDAEGRRIRTFQQVCEVLGAESVVGSPLTDESGHAVGAWLFINPRHDSSRPLINHLVEATKQQVGTCLRLVQRSQRNVVAHAWRSLTAGRAWVKHAAIAFVVVLLFAMLAVPGNYKVSCDCVVQPVVRRFVAAPYEGTLEKTLVEPGNIVRKDQVLAQMDGREIRLELQSLDAEHTRARMAWKKALSESDISLAQREHVEMKRIDLKIAVLRRRQENLLIRSPLAGIVVSGDLEKSEGAPLKVGQSLFEIAPLDRMTVEVEVPEEDISHVSPGMEVIIHLDAFAAAPQKALIQTIVPRAEPREGEMVFVAKAELDNAAGLLRPGMNGRAKVTGNRRTLAWRLFHKPYESLLMTLGW